MKLKAYTFAFLCASYLFLVGNVKGQNCDEQMAVALSSELELAESESIQISARDIRKNLNREIDGLKQTLLENLSARILLEVKSKTSTTTTETTDSFEDFYFSETEITSEIMLSNGKFDYCLDEEQGRLYGVYTLDPVATANATVRDAELRLIGVNVEVEQALENGSVNDPYQYNSRVEGIRKDITKAIFLYQEVDLTTINFSLKKFEVNFGKLKQKSGVDSFADEFVSAKKAIAEKNFSDGISQLRELNIRYPNRQEVGAYLNVAERQYESHVEREVNRLRARENYQEALESFRVYCQTMVCTEAQNETIDEIRKAYFAASYRQFETALKFDNLPDIGKNLSILRSYADVDPGTYRKAESQFQEYELKKELALVQKELDQENYRTVIAMSNRLESSFGYDFSEINRLREQAEKEIFRNKVNEERKTKRMQMGVVFGLEARSNATADLNDFPKGYTHYTVGYSFGVYKKFNYFKNYRGAYPKGSDLIGLKIRMFDHQTYDPIPWEEGEEVPSSAPDRFSGEVLLDGTALYGFHYAGGLVFNEVDKTNDYHFCAELGLRLPLGPVSFQGNFRTDWINDTPVYRVTAGVFAEIDFWRNFGKKDREKIKAKLGF
jgi:hypothetical protein